MNPSVQPHLSAIAALCRRFGVHRLDLFGSAARDASMAPGDFDFLVEFDPQPSGGYADAYFGLLEGLQSLLQAPVDLVVDSAIRNPYFRASVDRDRAQLYAA